MPAFNAARTIEEAIASTLPLVGLGAELVIVDDGSTDGTFEIVSNYTREYPSIRALAQPNAGPSSARRTGFKWSTGSLITLLDADDLLEPAGMAAAWRASADLGCPITKSLIKEYRGSASPLHTDVEPCRLDERTGNHRFVLTERWLSCAWGGFVGAIFDRALVERVLPVVRDLAFGEDLAFTYAVATEQPLFVQVERVGYWYRVDQELQSTAPESARRMEITSAFYACEQIAASTGTAGRALLWTLIQRYRWSPARSVAQAMRAEYRDKITNYSKGLRKRLGLSRSEVVRQTLRSAYFVLVNAAFRARH